MGPKRNQIKLTSPERSLDLHDYFQAKLAKPKPSKTRQKSKGRPHQKRKDKPSP